MRRHSASNCIKIRNRIPDFVGSVGLGAGGFSVLEAAPKRAGVGARQASLNGGANAGGAGGGSGEQDDGPNSNNENEANEGSEMKRNNGAGNAPAAGGVAASNNVDNSQGIAANSASIKKKTGNKAPAKSQKKISAKKAAAKKANKKKSVTVA
jgi:hypothetical protein